MTASHYLNPSLFSDSNLYCEEEEHWDDNVEPMRNMPTNCLIKVQGEGKSLKPLFSEQELYEDEELSSLLIKEQEDERYNGLEQNPSLAKARDEAVEWMLKVVRYYSFSALTAVLAVNYLDRFCHCFQSHREKPWMTQLAAVTCLSLAAKVEETQVPLLLDLQVEEPAYVFESRTIQRMEILVLSTLQWRMNPVTPLAFLECIARRLGLQIHLCRDFLRRCEYLLLSVVSDCRFMCHLPSALATAVMIYVISSLEPCSGVEYQQQLLGILGINKDKVEECCGLIQEVATRVHFNSCNKRKSFGSMPESPKGVVDVCFSSDSSNDESSCLLTSNIASVTSSPEPLSKKFKPQSP